MHWTHFYPHQKRGTEAMNGIDILPRYQGILCHDHWTGFLLLQNLHFHHPWLSNPIIVMTLPMRYVMPIICENWSVLGAGSTVMG
jgi:hypothetical protein